MAGEGGRMLAAVVGACVLLFVHTARSQPGEETATSAPASQPASQPIPGADKPWARGFSREQRQKALALYRAGNQLFADEKYSEALARYERAVQHWSHPGIHYNMVECLVNLGRNLEAHSHLESALGFGEAPLGKHLFRQAKTYRNMLERSLARVRVVCREPGARVVLDGKPLLVGPGEATRLLEPGLHAVVATKAGFIPMAQQPTLLPGKLTKVTVRMIPRGTDVVYRRRWNRTWIPWTVVGVGAAVAATALPLYLVARNDFNDHKTRFNEMCTGQPEGGCTPADFASDADRQEWSDLVHLEQRATAEYQASIALLSVGAAVTAAGIALVILNLPRAMERPAPTTPVAGVSVRVTASVGGVGMILTF